MSPLIGGAAICVMLGWLIGYFFGLKKGSDIGQAIASKAWKEEMAKQLARRFRDGKEIGVLHLSESQVEKLTMAPKKKPL